MKYKSKIGFLAVAIVFLSIPAIRAQERAVLYSHYSFSGMAINPAYTGSNEVLSVGVSHRSQWVGFEGAPAYNIVSVHTPMKRTSMGLGLLVMNESIGLRNFTGFYLNYSHRFNVGSGKLALGLKGGVATGSFEPFDAGNDDQVLTGEKKSFLLPNFGAGIYYYARRFYAGASIPLLFGYETDGSGEIGLSHNMERYAYYFTAGAFLQISESFAIEPSGLLSYDKTRGTMAEGGLKFRYKNLLRVGGSYRSKQALIMLIEIGLTDQLNVGVAYDYGLNSLNEYNRNSFEVALEYRFGYRIKAANPAIF